MIERILNHSSYKKGGQIAPRYYNSLMQKTITYVNKHKAYSKFKDFVELIKKLLMKEVKLPIWALIAIISTCCYIMSPLDLLPDLLPLGFIDDIFLAIYIYENTKKHIVRVEKDYEKNKKIGLWD